MEQLARPTRYLQALAALAAVLVGAGGAAAHSLSTAVETTVPDAVACADCRIVISPALRLGDDEGPGIVEREATRVVRGPRGRYFMHSANAWNFKVFDAGGRFLTQIGQRGQGPEDFFGIKTIEFSPDGEILVFDNELLRLTRFTLDLEFIGTQLLELAPPTEVLLLPHGDYLFSVDRPTANTIGSAMQIVEADGSYGYAFGRDNETWYPGYSFDPGQRVLAASQRYPGEIWAGYPFVYAVERWQPDGNLRQRIRREAEWFAPDREDPAPPVLIAVEEDAEGLLWTLVRVPSPNWQEFVRDDPYEPRQTGTIDDVRDTVIEVIDPVAGAVLARRRVPEAYRGFVAPGVAGATVHEDLDMFFQTYRLTLERGR